MINSNSVCPTLWHILHTHTGLSSSSLELQNEETKHHRTRSPLLTASQSEPPRTADKLAHSALEENRHMPLTPQLRLLGRNWLMITI